MALMKQQLYEVPEEWALVDYHVTSGLFDSPQAKIVLRRGNEEIVEEAKEGDGPIDAAFSAIERATGMKMVCKDYQVRSASLGRDAQGEVNLEVDCQGQIYRGRGISTDTVEATLKAILDVVNRIAMGVE